MPARDLLDIPLYIGLKNVFTNSFRQTGRTQHETSTVAETIRPSYTTRQLLIWREMEMEKNNYKILKIFLRKM